MILWVSSICIWKKDTLFDSKINMFNPPGTPFLPAHSPEECRTILTKGDFLRVIFIPKPTSWRNTSVSGKFTCSSNHYTTLTDNMAVLLQNRCTLYISGEFYVKTKSRRNWHEAPGVEDVCKILQMQSHWLQVTLLSTSFSTATGSQTQNREGRYYHTMKMNTLTTYHWDSILLVR
jgi:hypothetical protein